MRTHEAYLWSPHLHMHKHVYSQNTYKKRRNYYKFIRTHQVFFVMGREVSKMPLENTITKIKSRNLY